MPRAIYLKLSIRLILAIALFLFSKNNISNGLTAAHDAQAAASPDAIAIRVMPNLNHLSPLAWYNENIKVKGAPQDLIIDGYRAVRDGRTVYVDAANLDLDNKHCSKVRKKSCLNDSSCNFTTEGDCVGTLYTNIYIISYNQEAEEETTDIFGQILKHWKFNNNIKQDIGTCAKTAIKTCAENTDCPKGETCQNQKCTRACLNDTECGKAEYCQSYKATIVRDTKRLADLYDIKSALENYKNQYNGSYPALASGSYIAGKSVSVWPSWKNTLGAALGAALPVDPINKLASCSGAYDSRTCWDENNKKFAGTVDDGMIKLPPGSRAYVYSLKSNGAYNVCALTESGLITDLDGACQGSSTGYSTAKATQSITINCGQLKGTAGQPFKGYISASYAGSDILNWKIIDSQLTSWASPISIRRSSVAKQAELSSDFAAAGSYSIRIAVSNSSGSLSVETECRIVISQCVPTAPNCAANTCAGQICDTGCASVNGLKTDGVCSTPHVCPDADGDGYDICNPGEAGDDGRQKDCDGGQPLIHPGAAENCGNGIDENCDGSDSLCSTDTTKPVVRAFDVQPRTTGDTINVTYTVTDETALQRVELWAASYNAANCSDSNKSGCSWSKIATQDLTGLSRTGTFVYSSPAGSFWHGLHAVDKDNNWAAEPNPINIVKTASVVEKCLPGFHLSGNECVADSCTECNAMGFDLNTCAVNFPITAKNTTLTQSCPEVFSGKISATCDSNCSWKYNTSSCVYQGGCSARSIRKSESGPFIITIPEISLPPGLEYSVGCAKLNSDYINDFPCDAYLFPLGLGNIKIRCDADGNWVYSHNCR